MQAKSVKCVVVGDGAVGKTSLLVAHSTGKFPSGYLPTEFKSIRCSYQGYSTDIFIACFSVVNSDSFHNINNRWVKELQEKCPSAPVLLVGTKLDLRSDVGVAKQQVISTQEGQKLAHKIKAANYVECSALTQQGVKTVFDEALQTVIKSRGGSGGHKCCTLS